MKKKKLEAVLTGLMLTAVLLSACGGGGGSSESSSSGDGSLPDESSVPAFQPQPDLDPKPDPEPVLPYTNPLTGEGSAVDLGAKRPVAVMLNNLKKALPQLGVSCADVIYEIPAEGGITRMMALYQDVSGAGNIGSVRSARDYYVSLAYGHDAIFLHAGGSPQAYDKIQKLKVSALDCVNGPYEGTLFWRDADRKKNKGFEHSVLTSSEKIQELLPTYSRLRLEHESGFSVGWEFQEDPAPADCQDARKLTVPFSNVKTGVFTYDADSKRYLVEEYGAPYIDGNTDEQVAVRNVLVLYTDESVIAGDSAGRMKVRTTGTGDGLLLYDGKVFEIGWSRAKETDCFTFTQGGQTKTLAPGKSYINILGKNKKDSVTWEGASTGEGG